jgi:hypothetical protein
MSSLVARDGARRIALDVLHEGDAITLLESVTTAERGADPAVARRDLAVLCARLPLALRIAAEHALRRPQLSLRDLTEELRGAASWQALTTEGSTETEGPSAAHSVFAWSYRALPGGAARNFLDAGAASRRGIQQPDENTLSLPIRQISPATILALPAPESSLSSSAAPAALLVDPLQALRGHRPTGAPQNQSCMNSHPLRLTLGSFTRHRRTPTPSRTKACSALRPLPEALDGAVTGAVLPVLITASMLFAGSARPATLNVTHRYWQ